MDSQLDFIGRHATFLDDADHNRSPYTDQSGSSEQSSGITVSGITLAGELLLLALPILVPEW